MILVECNPDEYIISTLGFNSKKIKHQQGKGKVLLGLKKEKGTIGMIDEDPGKSRVPLIEEFEIKEEGERTSLLEHRVNGAHLIVIKPDLETWLLEIARANHIKPSEYGLPGDPNRLHSIIHPERNAKYRKMVEKLIELDEEMQMVSRWIKNNI